MREKATTSVVANMKNRKLMFLGAFAFAATAGAFLPRAEAANSPAFCRAQHRTCVESGASESYCESQYRQCRGY